ncbi:MAG TPA: hypothetical protein VNS32_10770 [Flavisolibacter sp.]|nr:hypothetical protein [Flavisolibacter sp.]
MNRSETRPFLPIIIFFVILNALFIAGRHMLEQWNADQNVLIIGNALLFIITFISFTLARRGLSSANPHAFVRSVYGSIMIKLFVCIIAAFIYISLNKAKLNKPALFTCMGLYLVYTFFEVSVLMKLLKQKKHE